MMFEHACAKCEKTFVSKSKLNQHNTQWHEEKKCDECGNMLKKGNFARHSKVHMDKDTMFTCQICAKTFNRKDNLHTHVIKCHDEPLPSEQYKCDDCEKTFSQKRYLKEHMDTHTAAPRKQCKYCEKDFTAKTNLQRHVRKCHPTPKVLENTQGFIMLEKSPDRNPVQQLKPKDKAFSCETCDFKTKRKYNLNVHIRIKHEGTPKKQGRKRKLPSQWSDGTKKAYAKKLKRQFKQRVKDMELEDEIKDMFKKDIGLEKPSPATVRVVIGMISDFEVSDRKMMKILRKMRELFGKNACTPNIREALIERKKKVLKFFKVENTSFKSKDGSDIKRQFVYTEDLELLLDFVISERDYEKEKVEVKVSLDGGQGRMLVVLHMGDGDEDKATKDTSTKRAIILAYVDDIPETHFNLSKILNKLQVHMMTYHHSIVGDLKLYNIILGLMESGSRHGCPFCKGKKGPDGKWIPGEYRTLESILNDHTLWELESGVRNELKEYFNAIHEPILKAPNAKLLENDHSETKTLLLTPIPPLHVIRLGPVNKIWKGLAQKETFGQLDRFEKLLGLVRKDRQKKEFQGPQCVKILNNLDLLRLTLPANLHSYVDALESIKNIYQMATAKEVEPDHRNIIENFEQQWRILMDEHGETMPLKVHIIVHHMSDYFDEAGKTLRTTSDQFVEAAHHKVKHFIEAHPNYNHVDKSTEQYGQAILSCVTHFNSNNL